jgi:hypothetical protein
MSTEHKQWRDWAVSLSVMLWLKRTTKEGKSEKKARHRSRIRLLLETRCSTSGRKGTLIVSRVRVASFFARVAYE